MTANIASMTTDYCFDIEAGTTPTEVAITSETKTEHPIDVFAYNFGTEGWDKIGVYWGHTCYFCLLVAHFNPPSRSVLIRTYSYSQYPEPDFSVNVATTLKPEQMPPRMREAIESLTHNGAKQHLDKICEEINADLLAALIIARQQVLSVCQWNEHLDGGRSDLDREDLEIIDAAIERVKE